jgi:hypothetical protein
VDISDLTSLSAEIDKAAIKPVKVKKQKELFEKVKLDRY